MAVVAIHGARHVGRAVGDALDDALRGHRVVEVLVFVGCSLPADPWGGGRRVSGERGCWGCVLGWWWGGRRFPRCLTTQGRCLCHVPDDRVGRHGEAEDGWGGGGERERRHQRPIPGCSRWDPGIRGGGGTGHGGAPTGVVLAGALAGLRLLQPLHQPLCDLLEILCRVAAFHQGEDDLVLHHDAARSSERGHGGVRGSEWGVTPPTSPHQLGSLPVRDPLLEADDPHALVAGDVPVDLLYLQTKGLHEPPPRGIRWLWRDNSVPCPHLLSEVLLK